jgi:DNA-binding transcriptional LysR family regulator
LTEAGRHFLERLQPALPDVDDAIEEMNSFRTTPTGTLRINTSRAAVWLVLAPLTQAFLSAHPEIHLEIVDEDGPVDIVGAGFDAGIRFFETVPEDMVSLAIGSECRFAVVGTPAYFEQHGVPLQPDDLERHECVRHRFPSGRLFKWEFVQGEKKVEIDVKGRMTLGDQAFAVRAALDGIGLAFVFEEFALEAIDDGRLVRVLGDWCPRFPGFMLYYPRQRRRPSALRAFIDMVRERQPR